MVTWPPYELHSRLAITALANKGSISPHLGVPEQRNLAIGALGDVIGNLGGHLLGPVELGGEVVVKGGRVGQRHSD